MTSSSNISQFSPPSLKELSLRQLNSSDQLKRFSKKGDTGRIMGLICHSIIGLIDFAKLPDHLGEDNAYMNVNRYRVLHRECAALFKTMSEILKEAKIDGEAWRKYKTEKQAFAKNLLARAEEYKWLEREFHVIPLSKIFQAYAGIVRASHTNHRSLLHFALSQPSIELARWFIQEAENNHLNALLEPKIGMPLHRVADVKTKSKIVSYLLQRGANPNIRDTYDQTPLLHANNIKAVRALLDHGADPNIADNRGLTALHMAALGDKRQESVQITKALLQSQANPNSQTLTGQTPLHFAVSNLSTWGSNSKGRAELVRILLEQGANPDIADNDGKRPIDVAKDNGLDEIAEVLAQEEIIEPWDDPMDIDGSSCLDNQNKETASSSYYDEEPELKRRRMNEEDEFQS